MPSLLDSGKAIESPVSIRQLAAGCGLAFPLSLRQLIATPDCPHNEITVAFQVGPNRRVGEVPLLVILLGPNELRWNNELNLYGTDADGYIRQGRMGSDPGSDPSQSRYWHRDDIVPLPKTRRFRSDPNTVNWADGTQQSVFATGDDGYVYQSNNAASSQLWEWTDWARIPGVTRFKSAPFAINTQDGSMLNLFATGEDGNIYHTMYAYRPGSHWQDEWTRLPGLVRFRSAPSAVEAPGDGMLSLMATGEDGCVYQILLVRGADSRWTDWGIPSRPPENVRFISAPSQFNAPDGGMLSVMATGEDGHVYQALYVRGPGSHWTGWGRLPSNAPENVKMVSTPWSMNSPDGKEALVFALGSDQMSYFAQYVRGASSKWRDWQSVSPNKREFSSGLSVIAHMPRRPSPEYYRNLLFGSTNSVRDLFLENSGGKFTISEAYITPWLTAVDDPETLDFDESTFDFINCGPLQRKGTYVVQQIEKLTPFRFSTFDGNGDGLITEDELAILWMWPDLTQDTAKTESCDRSPVPVPSLSQGVKIEIYSRGPSVMQLNTIAHELAHQCFKPDPGDMYFGEIPNPYAPRCYSLMDYGAHFDPFNKWRLGWMEPHFIRRTGRYKLPDVETRHCAWILADPRHAPDECFIVENRWPDTSHYKDLPDRGMAVWHIIGNPTVYGSLPPPPGVPPEKWAKVGPEAFPRRGIRMIRPTGPLPPDDSRALWDGTDPATGYNLLSWDPDPNHARLCWADGTPSGFAIRAISASGPVMTARVEVPF